jgi:ABC-type antimicrobial peptide transport system permease subunit
MLITVVGLLLLLACANVMNLLIARLIARRGELAVRTALGATGGRILRQIAAESLVLGVAGGALGLAIAAAGLHAVRAVAYEPLFRQLAFDVRVIGFAQLRTVEEAFADDASSNLLLSEMFAAFAIVALLLATSGLYGVMSYAISQRSAEIAIRIALGASPRSVAWNVFGRSLSLAGVGTVLGVAGAFGLAQAMRSTLYGVGPADPATYLSVIAITGAAAAVASWIPMRRAARVDPIKGLRQV